MWRRKKLQAGNFTTRNSFLRRKALVMKCHCIVKPWKNPDPPCLTRSQERDSVQPSISKSSPWGNAACHRSPFYCPSLSLGLSFLLMEGSVLSDKHWAEPYVSRVALCKKGGWVSIYSSTCEIFRFWPDLKGWDWITLHFISDCHWMLKIYCQ